MEIFALIAVMLLGLVLSFGFERVFVPLMDKIKQWLLNR